MASSGGGRFAAEIHPAPKLTPLERLEPGPVRLRSARALVARLPRPIAERELKTAREVLGWPPEAFEVVEIADAPGPGNALILAVEFQNGAEVETGFGRKGIPAERVAERCAKKLREFLAAGVPVGRHLADPLLLPMAVAGRGRFRTLPPTSHTRTGPEIIRRFLDVPVVPAPEGDGKTREIRVGSDVSP